MAQPHRPNAGWRDEDATLAQLVGSSDLAESRLLQTEGHNGALRGVFHAVLQVRFFAIGINQGIDTAGPTAD